MIGEKRGSSLTNHLRQLCKKEAPPQNRVLKNSCEPGINQVGSYPVYCSCSRRRLCATLMYKEIAAPRINVGAES